MTDIKKIRDLEKQMVEIMKVMEKVTQTIQSMAQIIQTLSTKEIQSRWDGRGEQKK